MTKKNDSAELVRIRINRQELDSLNSAARPALYEVGTLEGGTVVIVRSIGPTKPGSLPATERRSD